jgi:hypothetical protein
MGRKFPGTVSATADDEAPRTARWYALLVALMHPVLITPQTVQNAFGVTIV